jgi:hypothetical protein
VASPGKQRLDVLPNPRGPSTDHTKPSLILWNQPRLFALLEGLTKLCLVVPLVPAQEMDEALVIAQRQPKALGISPLAVPRGASGPRVPLPSLALPSACGTRGHVRPIDAEHHHRTAPAPRRHLLHAARHSITGRRHIQDGEPLSGLMPTRLEALTAQGHPGEVAAQRLRLLLGPLDRHLGCRLLHLELRAPWRYSARPIKRLNPPTPGCAIEVRSLHWHRAPHGLDWA